MTNYTGTIIEESLEYKDVLGKLKIIETVVESVNNEHKTPWLKQWTLHKVAIEENRADKIAENLSESLDSKHSSWYADFRNDSFHYVIFYKKIFKVDLSKKDGYKDAVNYGISIGIPDYQLDFK